MVDQNTKYDSILILRIYVKFTDTSIMKINRYTIFNTWKGVIITPVFTLQDLFWKMEIDLCKLSIYSINTGMLSTSFCNIQ